jgi:hypothetical protein
VSNYTLVELGVGNFLTVALAPRPLAGADPNDVNDQGQTPLHLACGAEMTPMDPPMVFLLLKYGAREDVRAADAQGRWEGEQTANRILISLLVNSTGSDPEAMRLRMECADVFEQTATDCVLVLSGPEWATRIPTGTCHLQRATCNDPESMRCRLPSCMAA